MFSLGHTRSVHRTDHLLHTPDAFVRTPLPALENGMAIVHASPQIDAAFTQMTVEMAEGGTLLDGPTQRFAYVLEGNVTLSDAVNGTPTTLVAGGYAYLPGGIPHQFTAETASRLAVIDKPFVPLNDRDFAALQQTGDAGDALLFIGHEDNAPMTELNGDPDLIVRTLLPVSLAFDFACNTMTYAPGASLSQVEVHTMEHGCLMLEGGGIYRLSDDWYPVTAGDFIWMKAYCPQWFCAVGKQPAKYLIYKDFNRHTLG